MISGIGSSGIDSILANYRVLEERPIRDLQSRRDKIDNRRSLLGDLKSKLSSLETLARELSYTSTANSPFFSKKATVSDDSYLTVTATSTSVVTSHSVFVQQLAKADKIISNQYTLANTDVATALGPGTYTFDVTINGTAHSVSVDIAADDTNETVLNNIVTAINNTADIGVRASVLKDTDTTGRLVFTSTETGTDYKIYLSDTSGSLLNTIGMDDSVQMSGNSGGYLYPASQLNAVVVVDGVTISRNSNTIEDAVEGLTLNLLKPQTTGSADLTVNVANDTETIKAKLQEFLDAYNEVIDFVQENTSVNSTTHQRAALSGDFTVSNLKLQLRSLLSNPVTGLDSGKATILAEIGITTDRQGKLSISDSSKLDEYLSSKLDQVSELFNSSDGFANRLLTFLDDYTSGTGIIEKRQDVLQSEINQINSRIDRLNTLVDKKIENYRMQFGKLQAAYSAYSAQYSYMGNILQSGFMNYQ